MTVAEYRKTRRPIMKKLQLGILFGVLAGLIDITPMLLMKMN